ncbi:hypothetical protein EXIGLDRAFT_780576 [Exidia glandulosa HHB12029]|uniref:Uncharacterized protein n=1 Tax=Exidia glandulosa HHB12029 TaxID=1314781 RepID=A0A165BJN5_EXIGL|nr:hypothetical protein EXIGLDRAFT_780576 [Exidia glandulosa HHB12029]
MELKREPPPSSGSLLEWPLHLFSAPVMPERTAPQLKAPATDAWGYEREAEDWSKVPRTSFLVPSLPRLAAYAARNRRERLPFYSHRAAPTSSLALPVVSAATAEAEPAMPAATSAVALCTALTALDDDDGVATSSPDAPTSTARSRRRANGRQRKLGREEENMVERGPDQRKHGREEENTVARGPDVEKRARRAGELYAADDANVKNAAKDHRPFDGVLAEERRDIAPRYETLPSTSTSSSRATAPCHEQSSGPLEDDAMDLDEQLDPDGFLAVTLRDAAYARPGSCVRIRTPHPMDLLSIQDHNADMLRRKMQHAVELDLSSPLIRTAASRGAPSHLPSLQVLHYTEAHGDMKDTLTDIDMDNIQVLKGTEVTPSTFLFALRRSTKYASLEIGFDTDGELRIAFQDDRGRVRTFNKCTSSVLHILAIHPIMHRAELICLDDLLETPLLKALPAWVDLAARELRVRVTGSQGSPLFQYQGVLLRMPKLEVVNFVSSLSPSSSRAVVTAEDAVRLLGQIVEHKKVVLLPIERINAPWWRTRSNMMLKRGKFAYTTKK